MTRKQTFVIAFLSITVFILAILVSARFWVRLDLSKNKAYTISQVSRNLYREIDEPVSISYYISDKLKTLHPGPEEIEDTLREYTAFSRGKIRLVVRDPVKAGVASMIEEIGLQPMQIRNVEQDQASFITVYSGIIIEYLDKLEALPWVIDTGTLEYDLTSRIRSMTRNTERLIGVIVGDSFRKWDDDFRFLAMSFYQAGYRVRQLSQGEEIPDELPGLFVFGGASDLEAEALYRIDRYIQTGGKVFFAVDGVYIDLLYGTIEAKLHDSKGLLEMIASYGAFIKPELVLDRSALFFDYQTRTPSGIIQRRIVRYPLWIGVLGENANPLHPVSSGFSGLDMYWASPVELAPPRGVEAEILFTTTPEGWLQRNNYFTNPEIPYMLEMEANETRGQQILAAALTGTFPCFFNDTGKPFEDLPDMPVSANPARIIVAGDSDFATQMLNATNASGNLEFLLRAADWLVNDDDMIGIRSRRQQTMRLDKIIDPAEKRASMRFVQILNVIVIPVFVIIAGIYLGYRRRLLNLRLNSSSSAE